MTHGWKRLRTDRRGGIEGLPLELMIIIIIATMATAILVGWMGNIETPHSIGSVDVVQENIQMNGSTTIENGELTIYVTDQDGNALENVSIVLSGLSVQIAEVENGSTTYRTAYAITDATGMARFDNNLHVTMRGGNVGFLTVSASLSEYGEKTTKVAVIG